MSFPSQASNIHITHKPRCPLFTLISIPFYVQPSTNSYTMINVLIIIRGTLITVLTLAVN